MSALELWQSELYAVNPELFTVKAKKPTTGARKLANPKHARKAKAAAKSLKK